MREGTTQNRHWVALSLALTAAALWGLVAPKLQIVLSEVDAPTVVWFRFFTAGLLLGGFALVRQGLGGLRRLPRKGRLVLVATGLGLSVNYLAYTLSLKHVSAGTTQLVIQLGPVFLLLGGVVFFRERLNRYQVFAFFLLGAGIFAFFHERLPDLVNDLGGYRVGVLWVVLSAAAWAVFGLGQKALITSLPASMTLASALLLGAAGFSFLATPSDIPRMTGLGLTALVLLALNTLIAYTCLVQALARWQASRVSAALAMAPISTFTAVELASRAFPGRIPAEQLDWLSIVGAVVVVLASLALALAGDPKVHE